MLAFQVESWVWYGVVLFVAISRLYVLRLPVQVLYISYRN